MVSCLLAFRAGERGGRGLQPQRGPQKGPGLGPRPNLKQINGLFNWEIFPLTDLIPENKVGYTANSGARLEFFFNYCRIERNSKIGSEGF
jgi:hypothetical protein